MSDCQGCENLMREMDRMANEIDQLRAGLVEAAPEISDAMVERGAQTFACGDGVVTSANYRQARRVIEAALEARKEGARDE